MAGQEADMRQVIDAFAANGFTSLFLGCSTDPASRSHGFYRHLGWTPTGSLPAHHRFVKLFRHTKQ
ncbi:hypothetical protein WI95_05830 [Burkholderia contaminans]|nr:hypothetical protein WI95_05830 [Burkholderia contaminans]